MKDLHRLLELAEKTARRAGEVLLRERQQLLKVDFEDTSDVKLAADRESEALIRELLQSDSTFPVYGEEAGGDAGLVERYEPYWVVDPLDGTHNYLRGLPNCAVSIGLMRGETPVLGVIYDFNRDECFSGIVADDFRVDGEVRQSRWAENLSLAALQTGFPAGMSKDAAVLDQFVRHVQAYRKVRMIGSAALALAWVAAGRSDVYYEASTRLWDVAAGIALIQAAGGIVRMSPSTGGKELAYDVWAAGRPDLLPVTP